VKAQRTAAAARLPLAMPLQSPKVTTAPHELDPRVTEPAVVAGLAAQSPLPAEIWAAPGPRGPEPARAVGAPRADPPRPGRRDRRDGMPDHARTTPAGPVRAGRNDRRGDPFGSSRAPSTETGSWRHCPRSSS
jgi:hypothetical protein